MSDREYAAFFWYCISVVVVLTAGLILILALSVLAGVQDGEWTALVLFVSAVTFCGLVFAAGWAVARRRRELQ